MLHLSRYQRLFSIIVGYFVWGEILQTIVSCVLNFYCKLCHMLQTVVSFNQSNINTCGTMLWIPDNMQNASSINNALTCLSVQPSAKRSQKKNKADSEKLKKVWDSN